MKSMKKMNKNVFRDILPETDYYDRTATKRRVSGMIDSLKIFLIMM